MEVFNHILVLTDFSTCSLNGIDKAKELVKEKGSKISVLHAYRLLPESIENEPASGKTLKEKIEKSLLKKISILNSKYFEKTEDSKCEFVIELGFMMDVVEKYINKYDPELIIMGARGIQNKLPGSMVSQVLKKFKKTRHIPIIAISAAAMSVDIEKAQKAGVFEYVTKPIIIPAFLKVLRLALAESNEAAVG